MSNAALQPIKIWGNEGSNPPKVVILAKELGIPYEIVPIGFKNVKTPEYLAINPNGRVPAIQDPNASLTLWESGAITEYLVEKYDHERKISFEPGTADYYHAKQWIYFQVSGQGPYFGQGVWFKKFHQEKLPSAVERYVKEITRVTGVLETHLAKQEVKGNDGPWLVGGKYSHADLSWVIWQSVITKLIGKEEGLDLDQFVTVTRWLNNMKARPAVMDVLAKL